MADGLCLLLTSTIQVDHPEFLRPGGRLDPRLRLQDYSAALEYWITAQRSVRDIVFVDNSGHPLDALQAVADRHTSAGKRIELISFRTEGYSPVRGRSYGELDIMRTALARSALLKGAARFAKVTGRVCIPNFDAIVGAAAPDFDIVGRLSQNLTWLETVLVLFRTDLFAERLLPYALAHVDDRARRPIERVLASACLQSIADGHRWYPFAESARIRGVRGIDNVPYPGGLLRARAIDMFARGHDRALDNVSNSATPHPLDQWTAPPSPPEPGGDGTPRGRPRRTS
jgi:hypothetical protein